MMRKLLSVVLCLLLAVSALAVASAENVVVEAVPNEGQFEGEELIVKAAKETGRIVTVEEHSQFGGLGAMVCETLSENPVPVRILGIPDENVVHGTNAEIFHHYGLDAEGIVKAVLSFK